LERHCDDFLTAVGFEKIDSWGSCYFHPVHKTFLIVYVDDFKMAGPTDSLRKCWALIQSPVEGKEFLNIEPPEPVNRFLGCQHRLTTKHVTWHGGDPTDLDPTIQQRIDEKRQKKAALREAKGAAKKAAPASSVDPAVLDPEVPRTANCDRRPIPEGTDDTKDGGGLPEAPSLPDGGVAGPAKETVAYPWNSGDWKTQDRTEVQAVEYDMEEFFQSCVQRYADMTGTDPTTYPRVPTPFGVEDVNLEDGLDGPRGQQAGISAAMEGLKGLVEGTGEQNAGRPTSVKDKPGLLRLIASHV
jgi:hypothetical protein